VTTEASLDEALEALFAAEREAQRWHDDITLRAQKKREEVIGAIARAIAESEAHDEGPLRLVSLARLLGELEGPDVADALIDILASDHPSARAEAGDHLQELAYDRFKEVALAVERALDRLPPSSAALVELPFILAEVGEGGVPRLLSRFLEHGEADVVAATIEALVELGDPSAIHHLEALVEDDRPTSLAEERTTLSELACDAIAILRDLDGADE
jgi:HEAT repeat protein